MARFKKGHPRLPGAGRKAGVPNKPKPFLVKLQEAFGRTLTEKDCDRLIESALCHAVGDIIVSENADGSKQTAKCVSDPRLLLGLGGLVAKSEEKKGFGESLPPVLDSLRQELEGYGKPYDSATA